MADYTWSFKLDGMQHTVRLKHGYWTGKVQIWADEKLIENSRRWNLIPLPRHPFQLNGHDCAAMITTNGFQYYHYRLFVDNLPVPSNADLARAKDKQQWAASVDDFKWQDLGRELGLQYWVDLEALYAYRHRLIGTIDGYLCVLHVSFNPQKRIQSVINVTVHHERVANARDLTAKLQADSELQQLLNTSKTIPRHLVESDERFTRVNLPFKPNKTPIATIAEQVRTVVRILARYAKPTPDDLCDQCGQFKPLQIAILNGLPVRVCASDLEKLGHVGEANKQQYIHAPSRLGRGVLVGVGVTLLGSLVWALALTFLDTVASVLSAVAFVGIVKAMDKVGTKRTNWSLLIAAVLAMGGVVLGTYLGLVGYFVWHNHTHLTPLVLWRIAQLLYGSRLLNTSLVYGALGVVGYLLATWWEQRHALAKVFHPKIEVLKTR